MGECPGDWGGPKGKGNKIMESLKWISSWPRMMGKRFSEGEGEEVSHKA